MTQFYRTVITIEVLSDGPFFYQNLAQVHEETTYGSCSGLHAITKSERLTIKELVERCEEHGTDPEFFLGELDVEKEKDE